MTGRIAAEKLAFAFLLTMAMTSCQTQTQYTRWSETTVTPLQRSAGKSKDLKDIDLTRIGHIAPKGRVQDKEYNNLQVVDDLIWNGEASIPFLISKLDDKTVIENSNLDYWPKMTVGDVAFVILSDFSIDSTWKKETIPGGSWDKFFGTKPTNDTSAPAFYYGQIEKHGRSWVKARWEKIWDKYRDQIEWDEQERCFKVFDDASQ